MAVVLTSATANGDGQLSFEYVKERLYAGARFAVRLPLVHAALPGDRHQSAGLSTGAGSGVDRALPRFGRARSGLAHQLLWAARALLRDSIQVFEQVSGLSRRAMIDNFRSADRAVMLGTRSFWEGVDIQGEELSALAICKLPFDVPSGPIFAARSETFDNAFNEFSVPETVLRFRQSFGQLIRSKSNYSIVVIYDRRVLTKSYGAAFLNALPQTTIVRTPLAQLGATVRKWLASKQAQSFPVPQTDVA